MDRHRRPGSDAPADAAAPADWTACVCWPEVPPDHGGWLRERLVADASAVRVLRRRMRDWTAEAQLDDELADAVVLIVDEAVTNAVEHACPDRDCHIELVAGPRACGGGFAVLVTDDGVWKEPTGPGYRGRGVLLIRQLAERSSIESSDDGTAVRLCWSR
jgi:serine/threonine-protein kinase RsbW